MICRAINELDQSKATQLVELEKDLNLHQEEILESARKRIDAVHEEANRLKMVNSTKFRFYLLCILRFVHIERSQRSSS